MPIVTSQYWNMVHGNNPEEVVKDEEGMQTMRTLGNNMAWLLKCIEQGKKMGIEEPKNEERVVMLKVVDQKWMDHIDAMDDLKDGIGLRAYGQQDPVVKYRLEGMDMFDEMVFAIKQDVVKLLMNLRKQEEVKREEAAKITGAALQNLQGLDNDQKQVKSQINRTVVNNGPQVGRNDACPCGSGKKYKNCCQRGSRVRWQRCTRS